MDEFRDSAIIIVVILYHSHKMYTRHLLTSLRYQIWHLTTRYILAVLIFSFLNFHITSCEGGFTYRFYSILLCTVARHMLHLSVKHLQRRFNSSTASDAIIMNAHRCELDVIREAEVLSKMECFGFSLHLNMDFFQRLPCSNDDYNSVFCGNFVRETH